MHRHDAVIIVDRAPSTPSTIRDYTERLLTEDESGRLQRYRRFAPE